MGRRLSFDRDVALTRATEVFWKRGYDHTSLAQLLRVMGVGEGSFYNSFKSKKHLYLECLRHYNATFMRDRSTALSSERSARERVHAFFDVVISDLDTFEAPSCLVSNSLTDEVLSHDEIRDYLFDGFESFLGFLASIIEDGRARGELREDLDPERIARVLFSYLHGLHRLSVYDFDAATRRRETREFVDAMLRVA